MKNRIKSISDLIGKKFGRLLVLSAENRKFKVKCDCGKEKTVYAQDVYLGKTQSCGCLLKEKITKHGLLKLNSHILEKATYRSYASMKQRCLNPKAEGYEYYGGRGIIVCDTWKVSFKNFVADMGIRPSLKHSIDRIDNNGNYCKENCVWSTHEDQMQHNSKTVNVTINGITKSLEWWCKVHGVCSNTVRRRMKSGKFNSYEQAILTPIKTKIKDDQGHFLSQYK